MEDYYSDIKTEYAVVVPVYNSGQVIHTLFERLDTTLSSITERFQIVFVDDGSLDDSWEAIRELKRKNSAKIKGIRLAKNFGQHNATLCGIQHCQSKFVITIDDDLEYKPEDILKLIARQKEGDFDIVYGIGSDKNKSTNFLRRFLTYIFRAIQKKFDKNYRNGSSFRLIKGEIAHKIPRHTREFSFVDEFLLWYTSSVAVQEVKVDVSPIASRYKTTGLIDLTKSLIYLSSYLPLKVATYFGFFMMLFNMLLGFFVIYRKLILKIDVKGYTSIVVTILFSTGAIIFCLGIIAEYIGKLMKMSYGKPAFNESEVL